MVLSLSLSYVGYIALCPVSFALALTLPPIQGISSFTQLASPTNKTVPGPASLALDLPDGAPNSLIGSDLADPVCNGGLLGFDLNRYSCLEAWNTIPLDRVPVTFGERMHGIFDVGLPRRFSGCECVSFFRWQKRISRSLYTIRS